MITLRMTNPMTATQPAKESDLNIKKPKIQLVISEVDLGRGWKMDRLRIFLQPSSK